MPDPNLFSYHILQRYAYPAHELPLQMGRPFASGQQAPSLLKMAPPSNTKLARCILFSLLPSTNRSNSHLMRRQKCDVGQA